MRARKIDSGWLFRLELGEKIIETLYDFCNQNEIKAATFSGIGGASWVELGFYHLETKEYEFTKIDGPLEVTSLLGNLSFVDGHQFFHLHANVCGTDLVIKGGHLLEGQVAGTLEIRIDVVDQEISRSHDENIGLKLLDL